MDGYPGPLGRFIAAGLVDAKLGRPPHFYPVAEAAPHIIPEHGLLVRRVHGFAGLGLPQEVDRVRLILPRLLVRVLFEVFVEREIVIVRYANSCLHVDLNELGDLVQLVCKLVLLLDLVVNFALPTCGGLAGLLEVLGKEVSEARLLGDTTHVEVFVGERLLFVEVRQLASLGRHTLAVLLRRAVICTLDTLSLHLLFCGGQLAIDENGPVLLLLQRRGLHHCAVRCLIVVVL